MANVLKTGALAISKFVKMERFHSNTLYLILYNLIVAIITGLVINHLINESGWNDLDFWLISSGIIFVILITPIFIEETPLNPKFLLFIRGWLYLGSIIGVPLTLVSGILYDIYANLAVSILLCINLILLIPALGLMITGTIIMIGIPIAKIVDFLIWLMFNIVKNLKNRKS